MMKAMQAQLAQKVVVTAEGQFMKLEQARVAAAKDGAHSAVVQAVIAQNRLFGLEKVITETTVRLASRVPGVAKELELSVEDWQRQQTQLLMGLGDGNGDGSATGHHHDDGHRHDEPEVAEHEPLEVMASGSQAGAPTPSCPNRRSTRRAKTRSTPAPPNAASEPLSASRPPR